MSAGERVLDKRLRALRPADRRLEFHSLASIKRVWAGCRRSGQARNEPEAILGNARIEDAADHVEVATANASELPFQDLTFDVVVSSLALHTISQKDRRERAIREIVRVLKAGGRLALFDSRRVREDASVLRSCPTEDVRISAPSLHLMVPVLMLTARKPPLERPR